MLRSRPGASLTGNHRLPRGRDDSAALRTPGTPLRVRRTPVGTCCRNHLYVLCLRAATARPTFGISLCAPDEKSSPRRQGGTCPDTPHSVMGWPWGTFPAALDALNQDARAPSAHHRSPASDCATQAEIPDQVSWRFFSDAQDLDPTFDVRSGYGAGPGPRSSSWTTP
jgi:hypothetical protein